MSDRLSKPQPRHDPWSPHPPEHTQPWGGWATHELAALRSQLLDLQDHIREVTDELDRRALLIESERRQKSSRSYSETVLPLLASPAVPYFGALAVLILAQWLSGDKQGALDTVKDLRPKL